MFRSNFEMAYLIGLVLSYAIRRYYRLIFRSRGVTDREQKSTVDQILTVLAEGGFLAGVVYLFTSWLDFANFQPIVLLGWVGVPVYGLGLILLWRAHKDLDKSWSPHVEIMRGQKLITEGVYKYIRHPMYAGYLLLGVGQLLLLPNWVAGPAFLGLFGLLYLQRVDQEETVMRAQFGVEYEQYMQRTGRLIPKIEIFSQSLQTIIKK